jgi:hypothetical protein
MVTSVEGSIYVRWFIILHGTVLQATSNHYRGNGTCHLAGTFASAVERRFCRAARGIKRREASDENRCCRVGVAAATIPRPHCVRAYCTPNAEPPSFEQQFDVFRAASCPCSAHADLGASLVGVLCHGTTAPSSQKASEGQMMRAPPPRSSSSSSYRIELASSDDSEKSSSSLSLTAT